ncbi:MAG TPA: hypothetical protein VIK18_22265 [Pirellulales bacterium]
MSDLPPILRDQRKIDADHLNLLSIFHFVAAGLALLGISFELVHFALFSAIFAGPIPWPHQTGGPPPAEFFAIFKWFYLVFGAWLLTSGTLNLISGFCLRARKHRTFSLVVAGVNCLYMPLGTILGAFTILVLVRDSVRELYDA